MNPDLELVLPPKFFQNPEFPFRSPDLVNIQVYATMGSVLPINDEDYEQELRLTEDQTRKLKQNVDEIISVYNDIAGHTRDFREVTFVEIVGIAKEIEGFSQVAPIYFESIINAQSDDVFNEGLDHQIEATCLMEEKMRKVIELVQKFRQNTEDDLRELMKADQALDAKLCKYQDHVKNLSERNRDLQLSQDARQDVWAPFRWFHKHRPNVKAAIKEMAENHDDLKLYLSLKSGSEYMTRHLETVSAVARNAIKSLHLIHDAFKEMTKNLNCIKVDIDRNIRQRLRNVSIQIDHVKQDWHALGERAHQYVEGAFIVNYKPDF